MSVYKKLLIVPFCFLFSSAVLSAQFVSCLGETPVLGAEVIECGDNRDTLKHTTLKEMYAGGWKVIHYETLGGSGVSLILLEKND